MAAGLRPPIQVFAYALDSQFVHVLAFRPFAADGRRRGRRRRGRRWVEGGFPDFARSIRCHVGEGNANAQEATAVA
eukprot:scaffold1783_cov106-Isochrysis_galbana.AAC.1